VRRLVAAVARGAVLATAISAVACASARADAPAISAGDLVRAYARRASVDGAGQLVSPGLPAAMVGADRILVLRASKENWRVKIAEIRSLTDGSVVARKEITVHALGTGGADSIAGMAARSDDEIVFAASNGELVIWTIGTDSLRYLSDLKANRVVYGMRFLGDGRLVVHDSNEGHSLEVWDLDENRLAGRIPDVDAFDITTSGTILVARRKAFDQIDARSLRMVRRYARPDEAITALLRLPDHRVLTQGYDGTIRLWNLPKAKALDAERQATIAPTSDDWNLHATHDDAGYVLTHRRVADGTREACRVLCAWSAYDGRRYRALAPSVHDDEHSSIVAFPLDRDRVATVESDGTASVWDLRAARLVERSPGILADYVEH
jgi:WD40 repeat protein